MNRILLFILFYADVIRASIRSKGHVCAVRTVRRALIVLALRLSSETQSEKLKLRRIFFQ